MSIDIDKLHDLATEAQHDAPGPYKVNWCNDDETGASRIGIDRITDANGDDVVIADSGVYPPYGATARHIAAASPDVVLALIAEVRALRAEVAAMRPVVDGAWTSYGERGALDLRVGEVVDEDDVRLHAAHCEDIGVPLRAWRAWRQAKEAKEGTP